jgi:regulator of sirC expression with transglutaminase-like and TPR domain
MPGHVLVRDCAEPDRFVDPFGGGRRLDRTGCEAVFAALHPGVAFDPSFLDPIDSRAVLDRVVANLAGSYLARGPRRAAVWALTLRSSLAPGEARRWRDLARAAERAGDWVGAASAWERFGELAAAVPEELQQRIAGLRARMN